MECSYLYIFISNVCLSNHTQYTTFVPQQSMATRQSCFSVSLQFLFLVTEQSCNITFLQMGGWGRGILQLETWKTLSYLTLLTTHVLWQAHPHNHKSYTSGWNSRNYNKMTKAHIIHFTFVMHSITSAKLTLIYSAERLICPANPFIMDSEKFKLDRLHEKGEKLAFALKD